MKRMLSHKFHLLQSGWHDVDEKILHACFDLLVEFVEKECDGLEGVKNNFSEDAEFYSREITELYNWWKEYTKDYPDYPEGIITWEDMDAYQNKEKEMLMRLMVVRKVLWT